jgi:hypothetical protein
LVLAAKPSTYTRQAMLNSFSLRPLASDQVLQAYPLITIFDPELIQAQWSSYAEDVIAKSRSGAGHGILTVQSDEQYIYGLSAYWPKPDLHQGRVLEIENFAVVDFTGNRRVARLLLDGLEDLGQRMACSCVTISLLNPQMRKWLRQPRNPAMDVFRHAGFRGEQLRLRKLGCPPAPSGLGLCHAAGSRRIPPEVCTWSGDDKRATRASSTEWTLRLSDQFRGAGHMSRTSPARTGRALRVRSIRQGLWGVPESRPTL